MQSRRTLTRSAELRAEALPLSLLERARGTFGVTEQGSEKGAFQLSSHRSERGEDQGEGRFRLHTYGLELNVLQFDVI